MKVFLFILAATILESTGDSVIRIALSGSSTPARIGLFVLGGLLLTAYGTSLNLAPVEFASVVGLYVAMVFVMFQIMNFLFFRTLPTPAVWIGGAFVVLGGLIAYFGK